MLIFRETCDKSGVRMSSGVTMVACPCRDVNNVSISLEIVYIVKKDICVTRAELFEKHYNA